MTVSHINFGGVPLSEMSDEDLISYFNRWKSIAGRRPIREDTAPVWIAIVRAFDVCDTPMTVRQVFYQLEMAGVVPKTEQGYRQVARHLANMRKEGMIPYHFIADLSRQFRKNASYTGLRAALEATKRAYRRSLWENQPVIAEIWIEKEALIGVIAPVTDEYDVPIYPCKGYPSLSFLHAAAEEMKGREKLTYIYYFGDYDPAGRDIPRYIADTLREMGAQNFTLEIVAVNPDQIKAWNLPTRPTKRSKHDHRAKGWIGDSTELDAIPPQQLRSLVRDSIERHIDPDILTRTKQIEAAEQEVLDNLVIEFGTSTKYEVRP